MTTVHLFPIDRWQGADPVRLSELAYEQCMDIDEAFEFIDKIVKEVDRKLEGMGLPPDLRRKAIEGWKTNVHGGLVCLIFRDTRDWKAR